MAESLTLVLVIILLAVTVTPILSKRVRLPVIIIEIITGIILGKSGFNIIPAHMLIDFFSVFGLIYIMFLAGVEINFEEIRKHFSKTAAIAAFSILIPFLSGVLLSSYVGIHPLLMGTIFSTTSLGIILPLSKELKYKKEFSHVLFGSVVAVDIISMFLLAVSLTLINGSFSASFFYSLMLIIIIFLIPWIIRKNNIREKIESWVSKKAHFETEVRFSFALIVILAAISEELGFHSIMGAFIAGLIISELTPKASILEKKLESFGYGFFIPLFFIFMGAKINIPSLFSNLANMEILGIIIAVGLLSKIAGVAFISKIRGFDFRESIALGLFHTARLSLIIAAVEVGSKMGLINENLFSSFMILAIVSAILGPSLGRHILAGKK